MNWTELELNWTILLGMKSSVQFNFESEAKKFSSVHELENWTQWAAILLVIDHETYLNLFASCWIFLFKKEERFREIVTTNFATQAPASAGSSRFYQSNCSSSSCSCSCSSSSWDNFLRGSTGGPPYTS